MKRFIKQFFLLTIFIALAFTSIIAQQKYKPVLLSPADSSSFQKTMDLELTWEPREDNDLYLCQYSFDKKFKSLQGSYQVGGSSLSVFNLLYDTVYYWKVRLSTDTVWSDVWSFRTTGRPVTPYLYSPANNSRNLTDSVTLSWSNYIMNKSYLVQISNDSLFTKLYSTITTTEATTYIRNLKLSAKYYWRVRGINVDFTASDWSLIYSFKTRIATPALLNPINNVRNIDTALVFTWNPDDIVKTYKFQISYSGNFRADSIYLEKEISTSSFKLDSIPTRTSLYWRVLALGNDNDSSFWSDTNYFRTRLSNPKIILPKDETINNDTVLTFTWNKIEGADNYKMLISEDSNFTKLFLNRNIKLTQLIVDSLQHYKKYYYKIIAFNKDKDSSSRLETFFIKTRLARPVLISPNDSLKNVPLNQVLSWTSVPGTSYYNLQISENPLFIEPLLDTVITKTTIRPSILNLDSLYYWRVIAFNIESDSSLWSLYKRFKTRPAMLVSLDSLKKIINLSASTSDTIGVISISNAGINQYVIDSIKIKPDSVFFLDQKKAVIQPNTTSDFLLRFRTSKADTGLNYASLYLIRNTNSIGRDTIKSGLQFTLIKSNAQISSDSLIYDYAPPNSQNRKQLTISNRGGNIPLLLNKIFISGTDTSSFKIIGSAKSIKANGSATFLVEFNPEKPGSLQAALEIQTNSFPDRNSEVILTGKGTGGMLAKETLTGIGNAVKDTFETFNNNNKKIFFKNTGNNWMNITIRFPKNYFKVTNDFQNNFSLNANDTVTVGIKYLTPNFNKLNYDTLTIIHNGFGEDTTKLAVAGSYDSLQSAIMLKSKSLFNNEPFLTTSKILETGQPVTLTLNPTLFAYQTNLQFRLAYYLGGPGKVNYVYNDGNYNFSIPRNDITKNGLIGTGELFVKNSLGKITDSISVFDSLDIQTIISKLKTADISVPRSVPAEKKEDAKTKWILFGFPFEEVVADSVFKYFGGMKNMKDGEWIVYRFNPAVSDSFSLFSDYYFKENNTYFIAQSLLDTFKISYTYPQNIRSRKLSERTITFSGDGWKTISSPFLFEVQVDSTLILRKYDTNTKSYKMTNIMKPGEGYFVEPDIKKIKLLTFGKYNPLYYPKALVDNGWFVKLTVSNEAASNELFFSILSSEKTLSKSTSIQKEYIIPPKLEDGLEAYITSEDLSKKIDVSIKNGNEGAEWNFIVGNSVNNFIEINPEVFGNLPKDFRYVIYNPASNKVVEGNQINIAAGSEQTFKLIIGTERFINETLQKLQNEIVSEFRLEQNYPNPFNPNTTIKYSIQTSPLNSSPYQRERLVSLKVYDILGREVTTLVNMEQAPGNYSIDFNASVLSSGIYFYQLKTGDYSSVKKMILLK